MVPRGDDRPDGERGRAVRQLRGRGADDERRARRGKRGEEKKAEAEEWEAHFHQPFLHLVETQPELVLLDGIATGDEETHDKKILIPIPVLVRPTMAVRAVIAPKAIHVVKAVPKR
jgi:hypothetical protein